MFRIASGPPQAAQQPFPDRGLSVSGGARRGRIGIGDNLEDAFGGLTIEDGLAVGDHVTPDFALLGEPDNRGDAIVFTIADTGIPVKVVVHRTRIASIEPSGPIPVAAPGTGACS